MDSNFKNQMQIAMREYVERNSKDEQEDQEMAEGSSNPKSDEELLHSIGQLIESQPGNDALKVIEDLSDIFSNLIKLDVLQRR